MKKIQETLNDGTKRNKEIYREDLSGLTEIKIIASRTLAGHSITLHGKINDDWNMINTTHYIGGNAIDHSWKEIDNFKKIAKSNRLNYIIEDARFNIPGMGLAQTRIEKWNAK